MQPSLLAPQDAYETMVERGLERLLAEVPAEDLAIQWDIAWEPLDLEGVLPWTDPDQAWQRFVGPSQRLSRLVPDDVLLGYHWAAHCCYEHEGPTLSFPLVPAGDRSVSVA